VCMFYHLILNIFIFYNFIWTLLTVN
jgi:hypothetical protein